MKDQWDIKVKGTQILGEVQDLAKISELREKLLKGLLNGPLGYFRTMRVLGLSNDGSDDNRAERILCDMIKDGLISPVGTYIILARDGLEWLIDQGHYPIQETEDTV